MIYLPLSNEFFSVGSDSDLRAAARSTACVMPASCHPRPSSVGSDRSRFVSSLGGLADATARVQPEVRPTRRPPRRDLVGDDDKAAVATHADAAAAAADVTVPYLAVPAEAERYAFPGGGVGGGSVARHFEIL